MRGNHRKDPTRECSHNWTQTHERPLFREPSYHALIRKDSARWAVLGAYRA